MSSSGNEFNMNLNLESTGDSTTSLNVSHCSPAPGGTPTDAEYEALADFIDEKLRDMVMQGSIDGDVTIDKSHAIHVLKLEGIKKEHNIFVDCMVSATSKDGKTVYLNVPGVIRNHCFPGFKRGRCEPNFERQTYDDVRHRASKLKLRPDAIITLVNESEAAMWGKWDLRNLRSYEPYISHRLELPVSWISRTIEYRKERPHLPHGPQLKFVFWHGRAFYFDLFRVNIRDVQVDLPHAERIARCKYPKFFEQIASESLTLVKGPNDKEPRMKYVFEPFVVSLDHLEDVQLVTVNATLDRGEALPRVETMSADYFEKYDF